MRQHRRDDFFEVCCPSCFETFSVAGPLPHECPTEWDYDCEICCRPMTIAFESDGEDVHADARGLDD